MTNKYIDDILYSVNLGTAPIIKNRNSLKQSTKGEIPITKNVSVVDEFGKEYEATYIKRAKGLVKNGRARFIDENRICLACPPNKINFLEDKIMNNDLHTDIINETIADTPKLSMDYVLSRIDKIINDTKYIDEALNTILEIPTVENSDGLNYQGDYAGQAKAEAVATVVRSREETNQKLIHLFEKMYDDLKPKQPPEPTDEILKLQQLTEMLKNFPPEISADIIKISAQQMFVKPGTAVVI